MDRPPKYPGYTAILPPRIRYDRELPASAKLLYAEITAMTDVTGFCWATNSYLGALTGLGKDRVGRLIQQMAALGYLCTEEIRDDKNAVTERRIYVTDLGNVHLPPPVKNTGRGPGENNGTPPVKNTGSTMNNKRIILPPIVPQGGQRTKSREHKDAPDWMPEAWRKLWLWYPTGDPAMHHRRGNRQRAIRAWDKLHPSPELIDTIAGALARQAESPEWKEDVGIPHLSTYLNGYGWEGWEDDNDDGRDK